MKVVSSGERTQPDVLPLFNASQITIQQATTLEELGLLAPEWEQLWLHCTEATPFQSPAWLMSWWRHLGEGQLWVLALRRAGSLVGVAPLFVRMGQNGERQLLLLGTGVSDYLDVLFAPGLGEAAEVALLDYLRAHSSGWDVCDFQQLRAGSALLQMDAPREWDSMVTVQEVCPVLGLPDCRARLRHALPGHMFEKLRYDRQRLSRHAAVRMESVRADNFEWAFENHLALHEARWAARGRNGVLSGGAVQRFHRDVAEQLLALGSLRLYVLVIDHRVAGSLYGFSHGRRIFYYLSGFALEFSAISPSTLMIGFAIEKAIEEGASEFDFLRGREAYKYLWGARGRLNYRRRCRPRQKPAAFCAAA